MADRVTFGFLPNLASFHLSSTTVASDLRNVVLTALAYYVACLLGFYVRFPSSGIAYIWPPNAILLAALLISKRSTWAMILGACLAAHGVAHGQDAVPTATWLALFLGNAAQAVLAASIVLRFSRPDRRQTPRGVTVLVVGAALAAPAAASLIPAAFYVRMGWAEDFWLGWGMRTLTNVVTTITVVPPLIAIFGDRRVLGGLTLARVAEFIALLLGQVVVDVASSASFGRSYVGLPPALYTCLPFAIWAAIRFGIPGLSTCLLLATYLTINSPFGAGLAAGPMTVEAIVGVQMFVALAASSLMFLSVVREETRQIQRTEEALYHSEAKSAAILRALPDLMFVQSKDSDHRYLEYYARDERDLLVSPEAFVGKRMRDVLPPDLAQSFEELFVRATSSAEPQILEYALPIRGEEHRFEARVVVCDDDRLLAIVRDVTEQKQAEAALQKADQALARMSQASALGQLAASIAHEVQQPLSAISINAAACLRSLEDDSADAHHLTNALTDIMEDSRRAGQVIKRTRELFGGGARQNVPVDLNSAIVEVLALTRHRAERNGQSVRAELDAGRLVVTGDRVQLQQVLLNLIVNGLDAMNAMTGPNRSVVVRSWRDHGLVHVAVQDAGQGFDPTDIERMFHTFYTTKSDGLGIGLAISRSIIQAHGGQLTAKLNPSGGATFELAIPEAEISAGEAALHPSQMFRREGSRSSGSEIQS